MNNVARIHAHSNNGYIGGMSLGWRATKKWRKTKAKKKPANLAGFSKFVLARIS